MTSLNVLAMSKEVLRFMRGPKDWMCVGVDINALEPHIIAHFSQCPIYMGLYGPQAVPNQDAYILLGTTIPTYAAKFLEHYDPKAPSKDGVAHIKANYDKERFVCKTTFLSCVYGIRPPALQASLAAGGVDMSLREVESIHRDYWRTFAAVKKFSQKLQGEWRANGGYIITGRGTPKALDMSAASEDILSRFTQTTGHQMIMRWIWHIDNVRKERGVTMRPIIKDLHDATYWTAPKDEIDAAGDVIQEGLNRLNDEIQLTVTLRGATKIGESLEIAK